MSRVKKAIIYYKDTDNIGDDIQTYAALKLLGSTDLYMDREALSSYDEEPVKLLCNGYFMRHPENWPPSKKVDPYFISMHISNYYGCEEKMIDPKLKDYYNKNGGVGCRDRDTMRRLQAIGAEANYSGCMTLTLPKPKVQKTDEILFVDAFLKVTSPAFENYYIDKLVPAALKKDVSIIRHEMPLKHLSIEERLAKVENFLARYAAAKVIITSRIHCALPCLAMGTPVYFMDLGYDRKGARKRFDGITDYMKVIGQDKIGYSSGKPSHKLMRKLGLYKLLPKKVDKDIIEWDNLKNDTTESEKIAKSIREKVTKEFSLS